MRPIVFYLHILAALSAGISPAFAMTTDDPRAEHFAEDLRVMEPIDTAATAALRTFVDTRDAHRRACRLSLQRANRDQHFPWLLECYRDDVQLLRDATEAQRAAWAGTPGALAAERTESLATLDRTLEALDALLLGIDAGVYETEDILATARRKLHDLYLAPYGDAALARTGQRLLGWTAVLQRRAARITEQTTESADLEHLRVAQLCLLQGDVLLTASMRLPNRDEINNSLQETVVHLRHCHGLLATVAAQEP